MFVRTSAKQIDLALRPQGNEKKEEYSARYEQSSNHRDNLRNIVLELGSVAKIRSARAHWLEMPLQIPDAAPWSRRSTRSEVDRWFS